jgi:hypothetical protein
MNPHQSWFPGAAALLLLGCASDPTARAPKSPQVITDASPTRATTADAVPASTPPAEAPATCPSHAELRSPTMVAALLPSLRDRLPALDFVIVEGRPWKVEPPACAVVITAVPRSGDTFIAAAILAPGAAPAPDRVVAISPPLAVSGSTVAASLDLAPYTIRDADRALGLRVTTGGDVLPGGRAIESRLHLFQHRDRRLVEILATRISTVVSGQRTMSNATLQTQVLREDAVLVVSSGTTHEYRDLVKRRRGGGSTVYRWTHDRYQTVDDDCVDAVGPTTLDFRKPGDAAPGPWESVPVTQHGRTIAIDRREDEVHESPDGTVRLLVACSQAETRDFPHCPTYLITAARVTYLQEFRSVDHVRWSSDPQTVIFEGAQLHHYGVDDVHEYEYRVGAPLLERRLLRQISDEPSG